jgi:hypothetical protein
MWGALGLGAFIGDSGPRAPAPPTVPDHRDGEVVVG